MFSPSGAIRETRTGKRESLGTVTVTEKHMNKTFLPYCGQQQCRETISTLLAQRDQLLSAAKAHIESLKNETVPVTFGTVRTFYDLQQAITAVEEKP
jgi:hypothetical protein